MLVIEQRAKSSDYVSCARLPATPKDVLKRQRLQNFHSVVCRTSVIPPPLVLESPTHRPDPNSRDDRPHEVPAYLRRRPRRRMGRPRPFAGQIAVLHLSPHHPVQAQQRLAEFLVRLPRRGDLVVRGRHRRSGGARRGGRPVAVPVPGRRGQGAPPPSLGDARERPKFLRNVRIPVPRGAKELKWNEAAQGVSWNDRPKSHGEALGRNKLTSSFSVGTKCGTSGGVARNRRR